MSQNQKQVRVDRIFVNSYTMKQKTDTDVEFRVDLGRVYNQAFKIEL